MKALGRSREEGIKVRVENRRACLFASIFQSNSQGIGGAFVLDDFPSDEFMGKNVFQEEGGADSHLDCDASGLTHVLAVGVAGRQASVMLAPTCFRGQDSVFMVQWEELRFRDLINLVFNPN